MKFMFPKYSFVGLLLTVFVLSLVFTGSLSAQSKKAPAKKTDVKKPAAKAVAKKNEKQAKDAKKDRDKAKSKASAKDTKRDKASAKDKQTAKEKAKADSKSAKKDTKKSAESKAEAKRAAAERRRIEAERRAAALAEARRREQARREAIARRLAFERGLRTETVANISKDQTEGEDLNIRQAAINALGSHAGSVVVMEAQTGKVLTIVNQDWAVRSSIRPCSTIKLVTAAAGLNEGVISKEDGSVRNTATRRKLDDAIAYSDNAYFQRAGASIGNTKLVEYGKKLGLGEQTGINLEGETPGRLPYTNNNARIYSHGDDTEVSTLQLAVMAAAITNGGHRVLPRIPRNEVEKAKFQTFYKANVDVPQQNVRRMIPGMMGAAEYGTARRNMNQGLGVAGKTGSCHDKGSWVGLFTSVAPIEQPKYAVAVITRGPGERGRAAAAVAAQVYNALSNHIVRTDRNLAQTEFKLAPRNPAVMNNTAVADADEDEDEAEAGETNAVDMTGIDTAGRKVIIVPNAPQTKKLVTRTGSSKPVLPPVVITYNKENKGTQTKPVIKP
ncbi:MAG: penicillin-binding transpeptidase domain-containing protein [Pyrinomonadaceae bacterium]